MLGLKTTCKDRWRQVTQEAKRIPQKHLLTLQAGISSNQLAQMQEANVVLVVPAPLHKAYPKSSGATILTLDAFLETVRKQVRDGRPPAGFLFN